MHACALPASAVVFVAAAASAVSAAARASSAFAVAAVVAVVAAASCLLALDKQNCIAMFNAGAMPYLIQGMKSDIEGMRAACAQTARNIYVLGEGLGFRV